MSSPNQFTFEVLGTPVVNFDATSDFITDAIEFCFLYVWSLKIDGTTLDGTPTITIEVSNDGTNWIAYKNDSTDSPVPGAWFDNIMPFLFTRINYKANDNTTGTVTFNLTTKDK